jgi:F-type H+-transporting ATPase subunit a
MAAGFKIWNPLHIEYLDANPHLGAALVTAGLFIGGGIAYRVTTSSAKSSKKDLEKLQDEEFVPSEKVGIRNIFESVGEFVQVLAKDIMGHQYPKFLPMIFFIFTWVLVSNLMGTIPTVGAPTIDINTTLSMGLFVFIYYNFKGFRASGFKYLEHFTGHLHGVLLFCFGWLMFPLELISHSLRPLTLGIRLRTNIFADHAVFDIISRLTQDLGHFMEVKMGLVGKILSFITASVAPIPLVLLGIIFCCVQALVFTLLTSVYISIATSHEDH